MQTVLIYFLLLRTRVEPVDPDSHFRSILRLSPLVAVVTTAAS